MFDDMNPQQKVAMALQMHRGLFPQKPGMGGLSGLGQAGLALLAAKKPGLFGMAQNQSTGPTMPMMAPNVAV